MYTIYMYKRIGNINIFSIRKICNFSTQKITYKYSLQDLFEKGWERTQGLLKSNSLFRIIDF